MKGERIHIFEKDPIPGGACDGYQYDIGYVMRGGREMDNHFEVMWDLLRSIPSLETEGASVLDEYYWLNKAPQLLPLPRDGETGPGRPHGWQICHLGSGRAGDHETLLHPGRAIAG